MKVGERGERRDGSSSDCGAECDVRWCCWGEKDVVVGETTDRCDAENECIFFCADGTRKGDTRVRLGLGGAVLDSGEGWTGRAGSVVDGAGFGDGMVRMDSREVRRNEAGRGRGVGASCLCLQQVSTATARRGGTHGWSKDQVFARPREKKDRRSGVESLSWRRPRVKRGE